MGEENLGIKSIEAIRHIKNWVMKYGVMPSIRDLMRLLQYKSPRSAVLILEELQDNGFLERKDDGNFRLIKDLERENHARTVLIPLVGSAPCGSPLLAEENVAAMISVSLSLIKSGNKYFLLRANGTSMNQAGIQDGDLVLVRQESTAMNGQRVVALIDDSATIKEFQHRGNYVTLLPHSNDPTHQPIILTTEFQIQGIVEAAIPLNTNKN